MSKPPLFPQQSASGIAVDPRTLQRIIPESKRQDGTFRKQIKIRPGFTPQEDVSRFRGTRQQAMDAVALPKGHILGWVAPSSAESQQKAKGAGAPGPPNKNAKKRANQRAKKAAEKAETVKDDWEDEDDNAENSGVAQALSPASDAISKPTEAASEGTQAGHKPNLAAAEDEVTDKLSKLEVK